ncbi:MAG: hypothetical protein QW292_05270 [Candidatus Parvarchaeota archaeon]
MPRKVMEIVFRCTMNGGTRYTSLYGTPEVREAIIEKVNKKNKIRAGLDNFMFIMSKKAIYTDLIAIAGSRYNVLI